MPAYLKKIPPNCAVSDQDIFTRLIVRNLNLSKAGVLVIVMLGKNKMFELLKCVHNILLLMRQSAMVGFASI